MTSSLAKDVLIIGGLIAAQTILSVYMLLLTCVMALGVAPLFLVIFADIASAMYLLPFALLFERKKWPAKIKPIFMLQMVLLSLIGSTSQYFLLTGMKKTSATISSAMQNLVPGITFILAVLTRFEKFSARCKYSRAKILGTIVCLTGAVIMSIWMNPSSVPAPSTSQGFHDLTNPTKDTIDIDWMLGCFYILLAICLTACLSVLQAAAIVHFPAPLSLMIMFFLMVSAMTAVLQLVTEGKIDAGSSNLTLGSIISFTLLGAAVLTIVNPYQLWCISMKGPVLVCIFSPLQTICTAIISAIFLGQIITIPSIAGMIVTFIGLYVFLWAKGKENYEIHDANVDQDCDKPLLA